jgi:hypothetical protein
VYLKLRVKNRVINLSGLILLGKVFGEVGDCSNRVKINMQTNLYLLREQKKGYSS